MDDLDARVRELGLQGRCCTQIMVQLALEECGEENPQMAEASGVLCLGLFEGLACGALTGGALAMAILAGERPDGLVVMELVDWFRSEYGLTDCDVLDGDDPSLQFTRCPGMVAATYEQAKRILGAHGVACS
ncbi:MAG TPA: C-GCAxxG-C-C family protein [Thermoleophilia bacterium]|nr:C-GCAxxG-C-C family protein [Thermoleophilia bacterium]HQG54106.1 C-GCAxxG-C-C family protein [Thermoleophilia bacterium]HQJ97562.1 C-GCAxxG-C-C family protein [Thermoleophilia bacterium]